MRRAKRNNKNKVLLIRIVMTAEEYEHALKHYSNKEIRMICKIGAEGELSQLLANKERYPEK